MSEDKNGYIRGNPKHSDLISRQIAYEKIYRKSGADKYPLRFREYVVHHRDQDKHNNSVSNLDLVTKEEHKGIHKLGLKGKKEFDLYKRKGIKGNWINRHPIWTIIILVLIILLSIVMIYFVKDDKQKVKENIVCSYDFYDCDDFSTRVEAKKVFEFCGTSKDIHFLDGDEDGIVCESLP